MKGSVGPVIQRTQRSDYIKIWNELSDTYINIRFLSNNDNSNIIEHSTSNSKRWLNLGGAEYYFNISSGELRAARLVVTNNYRLHSGTYFLQSLILEEGAELRVNGPVTIFLYSRKHTDEFRLEEMLPSIKREIREMLPSWDSIGIRPSPLYRRSK